MRSRLKAPTPISKMTKKRSRSPEEHTVAAPAVAQVEKKRRILESSFNSNAINLKGNQTATNNSARGVGNLRRSSSTGCLKTSTAGMAKTTTGSAKKPNTAVVKPSVAKTGSQRTAPDHRNTAGAKKPPVPSAGASKPPTGGTKKRPAWDLKGRLQDMEDILSKQNRASDSLNKQLEDYNERIASLESQNNHLSGAVKQKEQVASDASKEIQTLQRQIRETEENFDNAKRNMQRDLDNMTFFKEQLQRQKDALEGEVSAKSMEISGMKSTVAQLTSAQAGISAELDAVKLQLEQALRAGREKDEDIKHLKGVVSEKEEKIKDYEEKSRKHETMRRKLHNTIQELKGNIRVFCRVRPLLGDELLGNPDGTVTHMNFPDVDNKMLELEKIGDALLNESCLNSTKRGGKYEFNFDKVFQPGSSQGEVFEEISQLVQSALDGYNVCIFAYGQTGSGKTYTMEGGEVDAPETKGMIPRAVLQIFESAKELESKGWQYEFESSFLEIYNETIRDLLGNGKDDVKHEIKMTGTDSKEITATNLTLVPVKSEEKVHELLKKASHNRAVAETKCNERSSRSHSVFRLKLTGTNRFTDETCMGTLNLVDLAGSERLKDSGSEGQRLKETQAINKSLSCLGNVIMALGNKDSHIPYRNSKLTYLLQNSLGGNSKTLMFVNVSPKEECFQETLNSLRFATKVNQCNIGTAQKKTK